jgi:peptidoglycan biosynthesis protein MviN/MurJ (putative lipid II flippase)
VLVVILGRTGRTEYNFPAAAAATAANVALNIVLIPPFGIVGAGVALVLSYLLVLGLMYAFTQRLFHVPYEWRRLGLVIAAAIALVAGGELLLPTEGAAGLIPRVALWLAFPLVLWAAGFLEPAERAAVRSLAAQLTRRPAPAAPATETAGDPASARGPRLTPEVYEVERRDEDARL